MSNMTNEMNTASALEAKPRANGILNLTQYAFELVGAVDRLPDSPQRDEVLKQAKALRLDLATATRESLFDGFVSLEGLREKLLAPREIQRDDQGWLTHPTLPLCDEDVRVDRFLKAFGIESAFVSMESDVDAESYKQYHERADADCSAWTPTPPDGDGWVPLEIYDTEDGPYALYVREKKPETLRERWKREERERLAAHPAAPAALTDDEIVEIFYPLRTCSTDERLIALAVGRAIERRALAASSVAQSAASLTDERAAFEAYWTRDVPIEHRSMLPLILQRNAKDEYDNPRCEGAWEIWQARAAAG